MFDSFVDLLRWQTNAVDLNSTNENFSLNNDFIFHLILLRYIIALLAIAFYTLMERKFLGYFQLRKGPNEVILIGLPQPFADAIKLFTKEQTNPTPANIFPTSLHLF